VRGLGEEEKRRKEGSDDGGVEESKGDYEL
jgi:hypothetical protein